MAAGSAVYLDFMQITAPHFPHVHAEGCKQRRPRWILTSHVYPETPAQASGGE